MKEKGVDGAEVGGFKVATDGWHQIEVQEGIDLMKGKGGEGIYQDEKTGQHAWVFPLKVKDPDDESDGANIGFTVFEKGGGDTLATLLAAVGLWDALIKKFPGDDVTVFDKPVIEGIKVKLPGMSCMARSQVDKQGYAKAAQFASFKRYKEILAEEKAKGGGKSAAKSGAEPQKAAAAEPEADETGW